MSLNVMDKSVYQSNYEFRLAKRKAAVAKIVEKYSNNLFNHPNASINDIRLEAIKRNLESTYSHS